MVWSALCKVLQRQTYDIISHRNGTLFVIGGIFLVIISAFQFGEVALEWSKDKYEAVFNSFSDNVAGKSFQSRLCLPVPIDIVYTWVNGTDPDLVSQLRSYKLKMEQELNITSHETKAVDRSTCTFENCVPSNMVIIEPALPASVTLTSLSLLYPGYKNASQLYILHSPDDVNVTAILFSSQQQVDLALKENIVYNGRNCSSKQGYLTSDWTAPHSILLKDTVMMSDIKHSYTSDQFTQKLPDQYKQKISHIEVHEDKNIAVFTLPVLADFEVFLKDENVTLDGKKPTLNAANLVWMLHEFNRDEDISASRFEDNEELRYSLRSVERFAPWIRHVYIVTNGQIPSWLNLDSPRLTLVTHDELFVNKSHLPTFSSPAIESHLHRIPGLSDKFIYMNDDVMFGKEVWPDDFYTHAQGQKIYLTWPVPSCQEGCPSTWIKDGYCDKACNNSQCEWDGGDCAGGAGSHQFNFGGAGGYHGGGIYDSSALYCSNGCANNWIADRYCDQSCNVQKCGFDAGDCGTGNFHRLHSQLVSLNTTHYTLPKGEAVAYLNLSVIYWLEGTINEAYHNDSSVVRTATVAQKHKTLHILLLPNKNRTVVMFEVSGSRTKGGQKFNFTFTVAVDTSVTNVTQSNTSSKAVSEKTTNRNEVLNATSPPFIFSDIPSEKRFAHAKMEALVPTQVPPVVIHNNYVLPEDIKTELDELDHQLSEGYLTVRGHKLIKGRVWQKYLKDLKAKGNFLKLKTLVSKPLLQDFSKQGGKVMQKLFLPNNINPDLYDGVRIKKTNTGQSKPMDQKLDSYRQPVVKNMVAEHNMRNEKNLQQEAGKLGMVGIEKLESKVMKQFLQRHGVISDQQLQTSDVKETQGSISLPKDIKQNNISGRIENSVTIKHDRQTDVISPSYQTRSYKGRQLKGFLPWEKQGIFKELSKEVSKFERMELYRAKGKGRHLLDTFADSLRHVNRIYNKEFGYMTRKVPAHMPHMIDKHIMAALQDRFPEEWDKTSAHRIRSSDDMQYAFSYNYFVMSEPKNITVEEVFDEMDVDHSGVLSDRELRILATRLYDLPLDLQTLVGMEKTLINCSRNMTALNFSQTVPPSKIEHYYDKDMVQVTKMVLVKCPTLVQNIHEKFKDRTKNRFEVVNDEEVAFKMIKTNVSHVVGQLDDLRKTPKKFICLNDNIDHTSKEAHTVKAVLQDYFESIFPSPSSFELPPDFRNRFLHIDELRQWRQYRDWLKMWVNIAVVILAVYMICSYFGDRLEACRKKLCGFRFGFGRRRIYTKSSLEHV